MKKPVMNDLMVEAKIQKVPIKEQMAGNAWRDGEVFFQYLWPFDTDYEGNNDSLVLYVSTWSFSSIIYWGFRKGGRTRAAFIDILH